VNSFANVPDLVLVISLYGLAGLALILLGFVGIAALNRWKANAEREKRIASTPSKFDEIRASIRRAEDAARLQ
jgi:hypothetical protein